MQCLLDSQVLIHHSDNKIMNIFSIFFLIFSVNIMKYFDGASKQVIWRRGEENRLQSQRANNMQYRDHWPSTGQVIGRTQRQRLQQQRWSELIAILIFFGVEMQFMWHYFWKTKLIIYPRSKREYVMRKIVIPK